MAPSRSDPANKLGVTLPEIGERGEVIGFSSAVTETEMS